MLEKTTAYANIGVIGAGAWGTALAVVAAKAGRTVTLWSQNRAFEASGDGERRISGVLLPATVGLTGSREKIEAADAILLAVPAQHLRAALSGFRPGGSAPLVICAKGIEQATGLLMTEVLADTFPDSDPAILSGPSFARDVVQGLPTAVTIAARAPIAHRLQASFGHSSFRPYTSEDLIGVALGGAAKNVYAIACGIAIGLGLGESARAALLARSFAELRRLGTALGAREETLMGLSGLGDLVLTATSHTSRNYSFGLRLGEGHPLSELLGAGQPLAEGVATAPALVARAGRHGIELPVAHTVAEILDGRIAPAHALPQLMARPLKME
jgi:glycerol-3-phosphate dehydrogenase (NAD(P)+)